MYIEIINEEFDPWQKLVEYKRSQLKEKNNIGACSVFLGTMRDINSGDAIKSMELQHYPDMTEGYLEKIVQNATKKYKIIDSIVLHRVGLVNPSDPIVLVASWSEHRDEAFEATRQIMEALKSEAPFWKKEATDKGFRWVEPEMQSSEEMNEA
ncbi:MAG: molybdenum cofactor biosynthesis protein MoaE [Gammaproteobacteria bacterium]|jgi:molybdopterin synthase catalytic subunit|tara:strand:+ start:294 stop:752 length:459 start_codon:yes stop_codon:yes gene_type:complete